MIKNIKMIEDSDWDNLVSETYGRHYCFQQQDGCRGRGIFELTIPSKYTYDEDMCDSIPEVVNGEIMGVKFDVWLERDPKQPLKGDDEEYRLLLFWERNFYPDIYTVANDLHKKGLIEAGEYTIKIDW
jgi:hypothetical protein